MPKLLKLQEKIIKQLQELKNENEYLRSLKNQNANTNKEKDQTYYESVLSNLEKEKDDTISKLRKENTKFSNENQELNLKCEKVKINWSNYCICEKFYVSLRPNLKKE